MIKEALERMFNYGVEAETAKIHEVDGRFYSQNDLNLIEPPEYTPNRICVYGLESIVKLIKAEIGTVPVPIFVEVESPSKVLAYTTHTGEYCNRWYLYEAKSDTPTFNFNWKDYESAMIAFRSQFAQDDGVAYVLDLLSKITDENSVKQEDNGLAQTVEVKRGVSLKAVEQIKPIVKLRPYRTFLEVDQPASEFLLRLQEGGQVGLFEADGGMWRLAAKDNIAIYLKKEFDGMDDVIVMR